MVRIDWDDIEGQNKRIQRAAKVGEVLAYFVISLAVVGLLAMLGLFMQAVQALGR